MKKRHDTLLAAVKSWTPVKCNVFPSRDIEQWLAAQSSNGGWTHSYLNCTWYFEHERDALMFKLKWESCKTHSGNWWDDMDLNSMYPNSPITVIKPGKSVFTELYQQHYIFDYEANFDYEKYKGLANDLDKRGGPAKKMRIQS